MKRHTRFISGLLTILLFSSSPSYAWDSRGHMMVAAIAYQKLSQSAKDRVNALLLLNPDRDNWLDLIPAGTSSVNQKMMIFMIAATWPDRIKSDPDYPTDGTHNGNRPPSDPSASQNIGYDDLARHKYWHFVDTPFATDTTALPAIPTPNAHTQIDVFRAVLASSTQPDALKSYDLSWVLNLIGDRHQPWHATTRVSSSQPEGDDGGNAVKLTAPANLHTYWEDVLGSGNSPLTALNTIATLPTAPSAAMNDLDVSHWIQESFEAAKQTVYKTPIGIGAGPFTLTLTYRTKARTLAEQRVALAGARLAKILNDELK